MTDERGDAASQIEQRALRMSIIGYAFMCVVGLAFAVLTHSDAILLDGVYSGISFVTAMLALRVARVVRSPGSDTFHFGYAHFEPMLNALRGLLILGICLFALVSAVEAVLGGGRTLVPGLAVIYGVTVASACLFLAWRQRRVAKQVGSPLLEVDARNWFVDGMITTAAALAFIGAAILTKAGHLRAADYVDPVLVIMLVLIVGRVPLITFWDSLREILQVAPRPGVRDEVRGRVESALAELDHRGLKVRMVKVGRYFYLLIHVVLDPRMALDRIEDLDGWRRRIAKALSDHEHHVILDVIFTSDDVWVDAMDVRDV